MNTKMISLDISSKSTGVAIWNNGNLSKLKLIKRNRNESIQAMYRSLWMLLAEEKPDILVVEKPVCLRGAATQSMLDRLVGCVELYATLTGADFWEYRPSQWRKKICKIDETPPRRRVEAKKWAINKAAIEYGVDVCDENGVPSDDMAEAYLIGMAHIIQMFKEFAFSYLEEA